MGLQFGGDRPLYDVDYSGVVTTLSHGFKNRDLVIIGEARSKATSSGETYTITITTKTGVAHGTDGAYPTPGIRSRLHL